MGFCGDSKSGESKLVNVNTEKYRTNVHFVLYFFLHRCYTIKAMLLHKGGLLWIVLN